MSFQDFIDDVKEKFEQFKEDLEKGLSFEESEEEELSEEESNDQEKMKSKIKELADLLSIQMDDSEIDEDEVIEKVYEILEELDIPYDLSFI